eukprot:CAMPEP_0197422550 /NCGR_PEP_ID=MMETSP1170-20131217/16575_1 /TAXON_ID=54406 /ORGANISM="Sarcinochrysis sp, Strain CCMP770" /LENGTH=42 /DNA_ID= /DNA_START= /DNA_END= /DNA_ORIENTATION=
MRTSYVYPTLFSTTLAHNVAMIVGLGRVIFKPTPRDRRCYPL